MSDQMPFLPPGLAAEGAGRPVGADRAHRLAWNDVQRTELTQRLGPAADPTHSHWINKLDLSDAGKLFWGRIVDGVAYCNAYKVQPHHGITTILCTMATHSSLQPMGPREYGQLQPGTGVWFILPADKTEGLIIAVEPEFMVAGNTAQADFISQAGRAGLSVDGAHKVPFNMTNNGSIIDWSSGRPFDATTAGEKGHISATGLAQHIDDFMTFLRVDEATGVFGFIHDSLLRVTGHNLQVWSSCREREDLDDEGEVTSIEQYTPYYWEGLGAYRLGNNCVGGTWETSVPPRLATTGTETVVSSGGPLPFITIANLADTIQTSLNISLEHDAGSSSTIEFSSGQHQRGQAPPIATFDCEECLNGVFRTYTPDQWQMDPSLQGYAAIEPCADDQQGFYRLREFHGYLGQARKTILQLPPQPLPDFVQTYSNYFQSPGVYEENLSLTGRKSIRTAHEYIISKRLAIPSPKQIRKAEDTGGDNITNYKAAGTLGDGPAHIVAGQIENTTDYDDGMIHALGFLDKQAFVFNWEAAHPFSYHKEDWYLPEEGDLGYMPNTLPPDFSTLQSAGRLSTPRPSLLYVDARYGYVNYYANTSYFALLDSGAVVQGCGYGSEIRQVNGDVIIDAPNNIILRAGKNVVIEAGKDFVAKANYSVDLSANKNDFRIKAQHGLYAVAGIDGCGGILLESKALAPGIDFTGKHGEDVTLGGIVLKAPDSMIGFCSNMHIFSAPCIQDAHAQQSPAFLINMPTGRVRVFADYIERFMTSAAFDIFVTGNPCTTVTPSTSTGTTPSHGLHDAPEGFTSAGASGPRVTVPELFGASGPAGPINSGFTGSPMPQEYSGTFGSSMTILQANEYWAGTATLNSTLRINGQIIGTDCVYVDGDFCTANGHFFSTRANIVSGRVTTLKGSTLTAVQNAVTYTEQRGNTMITIATQELTAFEGYPLAKLCIPEFTYRIPAQYATTDYLVPEARWHQLNRASISAGGGGTTNVWVENPVFDSLGVPTYPYPGRESWLGETLVTIDTNLQNLKDGLAYDRAGGLYEVPSYGTTQAVIPDGNYPTIF